MNELVTDIKSAFIKWWKSRSNAQPVTNTISSKALSYAKATLLYGTLVFFVFYLLVLLGAFGKIPSKAALLARQHEKPSEVYASDGVLIGRYFLKDQKQVGIDQISSNVISALIATEDERFYKHHGIDFRSMLRVLVKSLLMQQSSAGGGSTITQQLAKSLYPRHDYWFLETPVNKLREIIIATRLENVFTKQQILELYLNHVHMGGNVYGFERAANTFFNKRAANLDPEEAAVLVGMLKASTRLNPMRNPSESKARRNVVIEQMEKADFLSSGKAEELKAKPLKLNPGKSIQYNATTAKYFVEMLRLELQKWCEDHEKKGGENYDLYQDGLKIYTTINSQAQLNAEAAATYRMALLQKQFNNHWGNQNPWGNKADFIDEEIKRSHRFKKLSDAGKSEEEITASFNKPVWMRLFTYRGTVTRKLSPKDSISYYQRFLNTGLLAMEPQTGYIKAWVGGINHDVFKYDHVLSKRQVGSTFKPILYAAALEEGLTPCQVFDNRRVTYDGWSPENADGNYGGQYTMIQALAHSVNTISAQLIDKVGISKTIDLAERLGIESEMPKVKSLALGTAELSLMEMVTAYATLANNGVRTHPVYLLKIESGDGETLFENKSEAGKQVLDVENAATIIQMMRAVVDNGSARRLRTKYGLQMDIAGKTGTTQNYADGWFLGIVPGLVTGVWVGGESPSVRFRTLELGQGANTALPIWADFMSGITKSSFGYKFYQSSFPTVSATVQNKLGCMLSAPNTEEEYYSNHLVNNVEARKPDKFLKFFKNNFGLFKGRGKHKGKKHGKGKGHGKHD